MHAIFRISAAPLLMLRGSRERKNDLQSTGGVNECAGQPISLCSFKAEQVVLERAASRQIYNADRQHLPIYKYS